MKSNSKILILSLATLFLQSCNESLESNSATKTNSSSHSNAYRQNSEFAPVTTTPSGQQTPVVQPALPPEPNSGAFPPIAPSPAPSPAPIANPQPAPATVPSPAVAVNCSVDIQALNWANLNSQEKVKISINPIDNYWNQQDGYPNEVYAYGGIGISFQNPYRLGSSNYFRHAPNYRAEGYSIKIRDNATGTVIEALDSDISRPHVWSTSGQAVMGFVKGVASDKDSNGRELYNSVGFHYSRSLYDKIKNINSATVSLHCNNALVAEGQQDIQSLKVNMSQRMVKVGTFQGAGLYSFPANQFVGFINGSCPVEIIAGSNTQCTGGGLGVSSGHWVVDGQNTSTFGANVAGLSLSALSRGTHSIQLVITYTNGTTDKTNVMLVKVK